MEPPRFSLLQREYVDDVSFRRGRRFITTAFAVGMTWASGFLSAVGTTVSAERKTFRARSFLIGQFFRLEEKVLLYLR